MVTPGNDDFAHMREVIARRFKSENLKKWGRPDLLLIDGGKGQLSAAIEARNESGQAAHVIGLAKREEEIVIHKKDSNVEVNDAVLHRLGGVVTQSSDFLVVLLPQSSHVVKLLQRIRDESHRFAVSYHSVLKTKRQTASVLDDIPGIGPATRKKLIKAFGSLRAVSQADQAELTVVLGKKTAAKLSQYLTTANK
jgi:excinuclease ABC subunit C